MAVNIPCIPSFDPQGDSSNEAHQWTRRKWSFDLYMEARGDVQINQKPALFLHCARMDVQYIFETLNSGNTSDEAVTAPDNYFKPQQNVTFERHQFRQMTQKENEKIAQFITRLRQQAKQ